MNIQKSVVSLSLLVLTITACAPAVTPMPPPTTVTVQLTWTHQAQFAGFYAADQNGYYAAEGLKVAFLEGGPSVDLLTPVLNGAAQFGEANPDALLAARADGKPLRAIAVVYRRSPGVYMALASSGITRPQDFVGKKIQVSPRGIPLLRAMLARFGIRPDQYTTVDSTPDLAPFFTGQVDVRSVFLTNEVLTAREQGYKVNLIFPDEYGIHVYTDTIFATDDLIANNPDLVRRFLRATLKGWTYAVEHVNEVGPMVLKYKPNADVKHETAFMDASLPLINTGEDFVGWMKPEAWAGMEQTLREQGVLTKPLDVTQVYTLQFVQEIYKRK